jgi:hypothetical protein
MKTKNQTELPLLELAATAAANEDGINPVSRDNVSSARKQAWSPLEVWRTRVKAQSTASRKDTAQFPG